MLDMHTRPSELLGIDDEYTAFCFDEACSFIISEIKDGKNPIINNANESKNHGNNYHKPSDLYRKFNKQ